MTLARFAAFLAAAAAAVAAWPSAVPAATVPTTWCGTELASADRRPDRVAGHQIGVVYAHPLGSPDNFASIASKIATDLATVDAWWRAQDPTRTPRFDRFAFAGCGTTFGSLDLARVTLPRDAAHYRAMVTGWEHISDDIAAPPYGFSNRYKKYLVYYDGPRDDEEVCGIADGNPFAGTSYAQVYLQACFRDVGTGRVAATTAAHELMHALGAVPAGAPHACFETGGHVCDRLDDVMYPSVNDGPLDALILDPDRDDYYGHSGSWFDLQDSFWLARLDAPQVPLTVSVTGPGRVASELPGIDCPGACSIAWDRSSRVPLIATPQSGARFAGWKGSCSGGGACTVLLESSAAVTATFTRAAPGGDGTTSHRLSVRVSGSGRVVSTPSGISCTRLCSARFGSSSSVSLRAVPGKGWRFAGWGAPCSHGAATCTIAMRGDRSVRAAFARL